MTDSVADLEEIVNNADDRARLADLVGIIDLLSHCILDKNYHLSDAMVSPLQFTELGERTIEQCMNHYRRLRPNDAKMAVFLSVGCTGGLLLDIATDIDALRQQVSREILQGRIRFPYIFGRELHDKAAELFPAQTSLDNNQTIKLLNNLPIGVFQLGRTVVGPYGCTYSDVPRQAGAKYYVPGYGCLDESCTAIHRIHLATGETSISKARAKIREYIFRNFAKTADPHAPLIQRAIEQDMRETEPLFPTTNLVEVFSDGLNEVEFRAVINTLLRQTFKSPERRMDVSKRLGAAIVNPLEFVASLGRPELLQIALLHSDEDLIAAADEAVRSGDITIGTSEVRISRLRRWDPDSDYSRAEIGALGARFAGGRNGRIIPRRMMHILHAIYYESDFLDAVDLAYAMEARNDLNAGDLLNLAVREHSIEELIRTLIIPNRRAVDIAARKLNISDYENLGREHILELLRWKIGEPPSNGYGDLQRFNDYLNLVREANETRQNPDTIRASAANLFAAVEDVLNRALVFSTWAFTTDHHLSAEGFEYDPEIDRSIVLFIESNAPTSTTEIQLKPERNTLVPLGAAFPRLAKALKNLDASPRRRPLKDIPIECSITSRPFAFPSTAMFFNLAKSAQSDILTALQAIGRHTQDSTVIETRNWTSHGDREFPGHDFLDRALEHLIQLLDNLKLYGIYPRVYDFIRSSDDGVGRQELVYESIGEQLSIFRPQWAVAPGLPVRQPRLIIMPIAQTDSSGPLRFRLKPTPGKEPYWDGWPKRWPAKADYTGKSQTISDKETFAEAG